MTYRVIQWSTGNVGRHALRCIERHPDLELVGLWVHSPDKAAPDGPKQDTFQFHESAASVVATSRRSMMSRPRSQKPGSARSTPTISPSS